MDGGNSQVLATEHESLMVSVTIDYVTDIIYWSEVNDNEARLKMMKMGESTRKVRFLQCAILVEKRCHDVI